MLPSFEIAKPDIGYQISQIWRGTGFAIHFSRAYLLNKLMSNVNVVGLSQWFNDSTDEIRVCCSRALANLCEHFCWKVYQRFPLLLVPSFYNG